MPRYEALDSHLGRLVFTRSNDISIFQTPIYYDLEDRPNDKKSEAYYGRIERSDKLASCDEVDTPLESNIPQGFTLPFDDSIIFFKPTFIQWRKKRSRDRDTERNCHPTREN